MQFQPFHIRCQQFLCIDYVNGPSGRKHFSRFYEPTSRFQAHKMVGEIRDRALQTRLCIHVRECKWSCNLQELEMKGVTCVNVILDTELTKTKVSNFSCVIYWPNYGYFRSDKNSFNPLKNFH